jgi:hypothetical protein
VLLLIAGFIAVRFSGYFSNEVPRTDFAVVGMYVLAGRLYRWGLFLFLVGLGADALHWFGSR